MSKKRTNSTNDQTPSLAEVQQVEEAKVEQEITQPVTVNNDKKVEEKKQDKKVAKKKKEKKPSKLATSIKETASELKKVTWPTFRKVVKQTSVVLTVVLIFGVVLFGIDRLLSLLFDVLVSAL